MSERLTLFVDVILPVPIHQAFTYRVPFENNALVQIGTRVIVPFGKSKLVTGIIVKFHEIPPQKYVAKYVEHFLDDQPIVTGKQIQFWHWMSQYYMAPIGDVMSAALPSNLKLASETKVILHPDFDQTTALNDREYQIVEALQIQEVLDLKEITSIVGIQTIQPIIKKMLDRKILMSIESLNDRYSAKTASAVLLSEFYLIEENLEQLVQAWENKKTKAKQLDALLAILSKGNYSNGSMQEVWKKDLEVDGISTSTLKTLEQKECIQIFQKELSRLDSIVSPEEKTLLLSEDQSTAYQEIVEKLTINPVCLLHGVTGSGKTEIYVQLIEDELKKGNQILFLVPEIALTTQLVTRLTSFFGEKIGVYHSKFNQNERVEIWNKVLENNPNNYRIVLGARSAIFLPFQKLGLIIIDEEHEGSFKQYDPSPRYNARDAAIVLAHLHQAKTLLGSATPCLETYSNAKSGKYGLVTLSKRFKNMEMPEILVADIKKERKKDPDFQFFTPFLVDEIRKRLNAEEQVILFQNRRGYNPRWQCEICNWTPKCVNCDVSMTYHKKTNSLKCHYCSHIAPPMGSCKSCGSNRLKMIGFGTEKIEDEMQILFPKASIGRLDLDTTRSKYAYENILNRFGEQQIDILIGTQMISKGLDFDNVSLVGIMDADSLLNRPDFRAFEKSFQMMTQVAGRAGRKIKRGQVIIQTGQPEHWVIEKVYSHDYIGFFNHEIIERENYHYPPFFKMIDFTLKHRNENQLNASAKEFTDILRSVFKESVMGPEFGLIPRINNQYIKVTKLKVDKSLSDKKVKDKLTELIDLFFSKAHNKGVRLNIDVDPQ
ncbi:MAG: primosomal protein N' [Bacteroidetes bacterium]|nr:primosomal protein N' [Bacteroidota bacterium]